MNFQVYATIGRNRTEQQMQKARQMHSFESTSQPSKQSASASAVTATPDSTSQNYDVTVVGHPCPPAPLQGSEQSQTTKLKQSQYWV